MTWRFDDNYVTDGDLATDPWTKCTHCCSCYPHKSHRNIHSDSEDPSWLVIVVYQSIVKARQAKASERCATKRSRADATSFYNLHTVSTMQSNNNNNFSSRRGPSLLLRHLLLKQQLALLVVLLLLLTALAPAVVCASTSPRTNSRPRTSSIA